MTKTVTRQVNTFEGTKVVEISDGGIDYSNPGALARKYPGELEEYADPVEAVEAAIRIAQQWQKDCPDDEILIDHGATGGFTMFFDGQEQNEETFAELRKWAKGLRDAMPKCDRCGEIITGRPVKLLDYDDCQFCCEYCAERFWEDEQATLAEENEEENDDEDDEE